VDSLSLLTNPAVEQFKVPVRLPGETLRQTRKKRPPLVVLACFSPAQRDSSSRIDDSTAAVHPPTPSETSASVSKQSW
jgi:hypothetical protein